LILLSDANVLIDLFHVDGISVLTQLATVEVLDVVFDECTYPDQIQDKITESGITQVVVQPLWIRLAQQYCQGKLSQQDALCLHYAMTFNRTLMTNEKPLRNLCQQKNINHHGILWIIQQAYLKGIVTNVELCKWLSILIAQGSRLPKQELATIRKILNC